MNKALNFLLGLRAGGMVGSAIGLMLAPASGRQMRADVQNFGDQMRKDIKMATVERRQEMEEQLARLRGEILSE